MPLRMLKNWVIVLYIFMVVYSPPLGPNPAQLKFAFLVGVPLLVFMHAAFSGDRGAGEVLRFPGARSLVLGVGGGAVFVFAVIVLSNQPISSLADTRFVQNATAIIVLVNVAAIVDLLRKRGYSRSDAFEVLLWLGSLQGVIAILGVLSPAVKEVSNGLYLAGGGSNEFVLESRIYGISSDYTFGTPIYHGALAGMAVHMIVSRGARYYLHIPLILTVVFLNGRTGLVVFALVAFVATFAVYFRRANILGLIVGIGGVGCALWLGLNLLARFVPSSYEFVSSFISDSKNLIVNDTATGNYAVLTKEVFLVPDGWGLFFGEGVRLYTGVAGIRTDIGFTNDLFAGGLAYWLLAYGGLLLFMYSRGVNRLVSFELLIVAVVSNLKGELLHSTVILFFLCFAVVSHVHLRDRDDLEGSQDAKVGGKGRSLSAA